MNLEILYQWREEIASRLPSLNSWQVENVALYSQGIIYAESSQQEKIARKVVCSEPVSSASRRLRRFLDNESFDIRAVFGDWCEWVLHALPSSEIYLCVDETKLSHTMGAMVVGVAWEGRCLPLAWQCYNPKQYPSEGQVKLIESLLGALHPHIPPSQSVCVLADRGIGTSPGLVSCCRGFRMAISVSSHLPK